MFTRTIRSLFVAAAVFAFSAAVGALHASTTSAEQAAGRDPIA
jgi:hypothetical protein